MSICFSTLWGIPVLILLFYLFVYFGLSCVGGFPTGLVIFKDETVTSSLEAVPAQTRPWASLWSVMAPDSPPKDPPNEHLELSFPRVHSSAWGINLAFGLRGGGKGRLGFSISCLTMGALNLEPPWLWLTQRIFLLPFPQLCQVAEGQGTIQGLLQGHAHHTRTCGLHLLPVFSPTPLLPRPELLWSPWD